MKPELQIQFDKLQVSILSDRLAMGAAAGTVIAQEIRRLLDQQEHVVMIFAAAPSQVEMLAALRHEPGIDWKRVIAFHSDEYIGLPAESAQTFKCFLKNQLFDLVQPGQVHYLRSDTTHPEIEAARYETLLRQNPVDIACIGIGENGHIAFNDPHNADFSDPRFVKVVSLAEESRLQQVHDGLFESLPAAWRPAAAGEPGFPSRAAIDREGRAADPVWTYRYYSNKLVALISFSSSEAAS